MGGIRVQHFGYAGNLRRRRGDGRGLMAGHQHVNFSADALCRGDRMECRAIELRIVVAGENQGRHDVAPVQAITLASLRSFATSSCTLATLPPPLRLEGSTTISVARRGATSTPKASGVKVSRGFFFAFMMLGSVAYRGSFSLTSVVMSTGS